MKITLGSYEILFDNMMFFLKDLPLRDGTIHVEKAWRVPVALKGMRADEFFVHFDAKTRFVGKLHIAVADDDRFLQVTDAKVAAVSLAPSAEVL